MLNVSFKPHYFFFLFNYSLHHRNQFGTDMNRKRQRETTVAGSRVPPLLLSLISFPLIQPHLSS